MKLYRCNTCGNIVAIVNDGGVIPNCCGAPMELLEPNVTDGTKEKHVPVVDCAYGVVTVKVGEDPHPMLDEHFIQMIILETDKDIYIRYLRPGDNPGACFKVCDDEKVMKVYEYCNIHFLYMKEVLCETK